MFKNKQIYIFISFICASTLSLHSMEQTPITVPGLQNFLNIQQTKLYKYNDVFENQKLSVKFVFQRQIDNAQKQLNENPSFHDLYSIRDFIDQISSNLDNLIREAAYEQKRLNKLLNKNIQESITVTQQIISPQNHVENLSPQYERSPSVPKLSQKSFSSQNCQPVDLGPKFNSFKRFLTYFNGAIMCAGIGLYSYYKLPEQLQWYRPVFIGLSAFGGTACSILAYKNLKFFISKYDTM